MYLEGIYWTNRARLNNSRNILWNVYCDGDETSFTDCQGWWDPFREAGCTHAVDLVCPLAPEIGTLGELRLASIVDDNNTISGRLEVYNGIWGSGAFNS